MSSQSSVNPGAKAVSRWGAFGNLAFVVILVASSLSNVGIAMFDTAASWLMTNLNADPMMVSAVQVATMLPLFLLTLPAGALTDIVDARRLLIGAQAAVAAVSIAFAALVTFNLATPTALLSTTFVLGAGGALSAPAWLLVTPMLVSKEDLENAVAVNNTSFNVSRAIGPALAGFTMAAIGLGFPFWCYCAGNLIVLAALLWWRGPRRPPETLPAERLSSALKAGVRYVRYNRDMDVTLVRTVAFFLFGSAYWALLPLVARSQMHDGATLYGVLLGAIGLGSIVGSVALNWLKDRMSPDWLARLGTVGTIAALVMYGLATRPAVAVAASLIAGASWILMLTTLFMSAQLALPDWVRGRGLSIYLTAYFGAMTAGSAVWGKFASVEGLPMTFFAAAAGASLGLALTWGRKLQAAAALDLTPSRHWRAPSFVLNADDDQGPLLITVDYRVDPAEKAGFLAAMREIGFERKRDGAYAWNLFEDIRQPGRFVETFLVQSLLELKHLRARVTKADRILEEQVTAFLTEQRRVTFLIVPKRSRPDRRKPPILAAEPALE